MSKEPGALQKDYPEALMPVLGPYRDRMGFVPNALKLYMHRPEIAGTLWALNSNVMRDPSSTLDQNLKRRLSAVCSVINGCGLLFGPLLLDVEERRRCAVGRMGHGGGGPAGPRHRRFGARK